MAMLPNNCEKTKTKRLSSVGPGFISHCLKNEISRCKCTVLQPMPKLPLFPGQDLNKEVKGDTLISSSGELILLLWKDDSDDFNLTVIRLEKEEVRSAISFKNVSEKVNVTGHHKASAYSKKTIFIYL